jgi:hypothetical protein
LKTSLALEVPDETMQVTDDELENLDEIDKIGVEYVMNIIAEVNDEQEQNVLEVEVEVEEVLQNGLDTEVIDVTDVQQLE